MKELRESTGLNHLVGSLAEDVKWWIGKKMKMPLEELAGNYLKMIGYVMEAVV